MRGRGNRQELGQPLDHPEQRGDEIGQRAGLTTRARGALAPRTRRRVAACRPPLSAVRRRFRLRMIAIADAMKMVEYVPLMMPTSIVNANPEAPRRRTDTATARTGTSCRR